MASQNKCLVCDSNNIAFHLRCKDHFTSGEDFDIFICNNCGFLFTMNPPVESEIGKYYNTRDYISHSDTKKGIINFLFHLTRNLMLYRKRNIVRKVSGLKSGILLDIGSGTGYFPAFMKKEGWVVTGLEVNDKARKYAIDKFDINVITENEISKCKKGQFDCITLWHVLEHFHDPFKYTSDIIRLLKPGGLCLIALPNCSSYDAKYYGQYWAAYDVPRHLWHFNPSSFRIFSEKAGFVVEKLRNLPLDVFYISILSERYKGSKLAFLSGMVKALPFAFLSVFRKRRSSSVIYILRKSID